MRARAENSNGQTRRKRLLQERRYTVTVYKSRVNFDDYAVYQDLRYTLTRMFEESEQTCNGFS